MIEFRLPSLGSDMDEGTLLEWRVQPGERVARGQVVAVVDTAKAAIDVECWQEGIVHSLLVEPGSKIPVGTAMALLRGVDEAGTEPALPAAPAPAGPSRSSERTRISPLARRRAQELGVDLSGLTGSGPQGALSLADVEAVAQVHAPSPTRTSRAQEMRRVIAAAMSRSKREIPHYYLAEDVPFEQAAGWLAERNRELPVTERLLPAALLIKAVALSLQRYPEFNGFWRDGGFVPGAGVHIGVAVSLREGGLVAPALRDVPSLDVAALTRSLLDLVKRTRAGALRSSELADATITVTNLGDQGVDAVFGVIYPPQVALVGFGKVALRACATADGGVRASPVVTATLAADHRASDGHRGALLLGEVSALLQEPDALDRTGDPAS